MTNETLIGAGKTLEDITIGLDTIILNESKHWFTDAKTKRFYSKIKVVEEDGEYKVFMTGVPEDGLERKGYENG